jgi:hypothetical protein
VLPQQIPHFMHRKRTTAGYSKLILVPDKTQYLRGRQ